jgi:CTP:molybdopterin cytidylyltransferase MocA
LQDTTVSKIRKAVFPAAGLGTRFLPATKVVPKEMLPIVDTPQIQLAVQEALDAGIEEIILITGRGKGRNFWESPGCFNPSKKSTRSGPCRSLRQKCSGR